MRRAASKTTRSWTCRSSGWCPCRLAGGRAGGGRGCSPRTARGRVLVIGDFDADGATSTALMVRALRALHFAHVDFLVPNRFRFGYGLTPEIVALAAARAPSLIVTVDNGVSSVAGVEAARALGDSGAGDRSSSAGRRAAARRSHRQSQSAGQPLREPGAGRRRRGLLRDRGARARRWASDFRVAELLDLVALGTVADVVPLDRNNRMLVAQGLQRIRAGRCVPGIRALLESRRARRRAASPPPIWALRWRRA